MTGQLYYNYYLRSARTGHLEDAFAFYRHVMDEEYFAGLQHDPALGGKVSARGRATETEKPPPIGNAKADRIAMIFRPCGSSRGTP